MVNQMPDELKEVFEESGKRLKAVNDFIAAGGDTKSEEFRQLGLHYLEAGEKFNTMAKQLTEEK